MDKAIVRLEAISHTLGNALVKLFHTLALFAIGAAVVWAGTYAYIGMMDKGHFSIEDILLLFIYLELGAMVGIYFKTAKMPVRFLIYVAITALTRMMIGMINVTHKADMGVLIASTAIFILTLAALVIRYGSYKMPLDTGLEELSDHTPLAASKELKMRKNTKNG
jgi:protein PsiE